MVKVPEKLLKLYKYEWVYFKEILLTKIKILTIYRIMYTVAEYNQNCNVH